MTAISIKSIHETGPNWPGNDEVDVLLNDFTSNGFTNMTFWNVDAGETFTVPTGKQCIQPQPSCTSGVANVRFRVALWERDEPPPPLAQFCYGTTSDGGYLFDHGVCSGSQLIGRAEVTRSQEELVAAIPAVGGSVETTIKPSGGDGNYQFTFRITRLPDVGRDLVIGPATDPVIALQASIAPASGNQWRVTLGWTGATGNSVDIYRDGAPLVTTANDGSHVDNVQMGSYVYRLCNFQTTYCSSDVTVTAQ